MSVYRELLRLYPAGFRNEYGEEMCAVFEEKRRRASGFFQVSALWVEVLFDVIRHAIPLHADSVWQDLRYTGRSLLRAPVFALTVVLVAALGIGANTAVFTVVDHVLIRPLPFQGADRVVRVWESPPGYTRMEVSPPNYRDWQSTVTSFDAMAAYNRTSANVVGQGDPERIQGAALGAGLLPILGVAPVLGRDFSEDDSVEGAPATVILSYGLWRRSFGGDPRALGRTIVLDDEQHVIIGVMPPGFMFPDRRGEYWTALQLGPNDYGDRNNNYLEVIARLQDGVSLEMARAEMAQVMRQLAIAHPAENESKTATVKRCPGRAPSH